MESFERTFEPEEGMRVGATLFTSGRLPLEPDALRQLKDACRVPTVRRVLATPDIHVGYGVPIGCVMATEGVVVPAAVGYDINCGMRVLTTDRAAAGADLGAVARAIRADVPLGEGKRNVPMDRAEFLEVLASGVPALSAVRRRDHAAWSWIEAAAPSLRIEDGGAMAGEVAALSPHAIERGQNQLGTLGGGNHFIELQEVTDLEDPQTAQAWGLFPGQLLVMIHSGSRGFGHQVGEEYMALARSRTFGEPAVNREICHLPVDSKEGRAYLGAMRAGANLAFANRHLLAALVRKSLDRLLGARADLLYDVPHNMAKAEVHGGRTLWVHRKGATRALPGGAMAGTPFAATGQPVLIPGSMGTASYLLAGVPENARALNSANHGAGRRMSRTAAAGVVRRGKVLRPGRITDREFSEAMEGVQLFCEDRATIKEEAPQAYKDIDAVIEVVRGAGLARVVARLRPLAVLKG